MFVSRHCDGVSGLPVNSTFGTRMLKAALAKTLSVKSERAVTPQTRLVGDATLSPVFVAKLAGASSWPHFGWQSVRSHAGRGHFGGMLQTEGYERYA